MTTEQLEKIRMKKPAAIPGTHWAIRNVLYGTFLHRNLFTPLTFDTRDAADRYMARRRISRKIYRIVEMERMVRNDSRTA